MRLSAVIDNGKLQLGHTLELGFSFLHLLRIQSRNLNQDAIFSLWRYNGLTHPVLVNTLTNDFHSLFEQGRCDAGLRLRNETNEERGPSLQIQAESDFLGGRDDLFHTECRQK